LVRPATGLSQNETDWLILRRSNAIDALETWLPRALAIVQNNTFDLTEYICTLRSNSSFVPVTGLAFSGGGARAALSGYGAWQALDERYPPSRKAGTGGIAQALTYLSALSGGGQPVGAISMSNYATLEQLLHYGTDQGNITASPAGDPNPTVAHAATLQYLQQISLKAEKGFNVSVTDLFAFVIGSQILFNESAGVSTARMARTWSDIQSYPEFADGKYPMPIVMANEIVLPGIPDVTEFFGSVRPFYNASNNTIVCLSSSLADL
jgi:lysophospholipase